jgi:Tfp pilus assembly protein PilO
VDLSPGKKLALWQIDAAGIVVCIVASLLAYLVGVRQLIEQRSLLAGQREKLAVQREKFSKLEASMLSLRQQSVILQEQLAQSEIELESADQINRRIAELTTLFGDCSLEVDDVQTGKIVTGPKSDLVPISIAGRGGYRQCAAFLHKLCRTFPDISVTRFDLTGNPARPRELGKFHLELLWHAAVKARMARNPVFGAFRKCRSCRAGIT